MRLLGNIASGRLLLAMSFAAAVAACAPPHVPPGFGPAGAESREGRHIARCNTVHSLTLPKQIIQRYGLEANENTAIISCELQLQDAGPPRNVPARISGTQTLLTGRTTPLEFKEIEDEGSVSYLAPFSIAAKLAIEFDVALTDTRTGETYRVKLRQSELPGRR
jgi:Domain of unknown function (DUF4426)